MEYIKIMNLKKIGIIVMSLLLYTSVSYSYKVNFFDDAKNFIELTEKPKRIVSLSPSITEILYEIGEREHIKGITYYDEYEIDDAYIVGGFLYPSVTKIKEINPDIIFCSKKNIEAINELKKDGIKIVVFEPKDINSLYKTIKILSNIFEKKDDGLKLINKIKHQLDHIQKKLNHIKKQQRLRVMRIMGRNVLMTPTVNSFQNQLIRLAGGIPPSFQGDGAIVEVSKKDWITFNPQVVYFCGGDSKLINKIKSLPEWSAVSAIRNNRIYSYPCALTCRLSAHTGYFVSWLASDIYSKEFLDERYWVNKDKIISKRKIPVSLDYIKNVYFIKSSIFDFINKTILITFKTPMNIISTLEGPRYNIINIGNHYTPPPCWRITHHLGLEKSRNRIYKALELKKENSSFLFTGADMDNLAMIKKQYKDLLIYVFATAGVQTNAMRMSKDVGNYYEIDPGTINMIIMTNVKLTPRAMTRAIITATEAKSALLSDLDIRSSYNPQRYQATGTGTDNIIIVQGDGKFILDNAGGHSKLGELIAKAVYDAVKIAIKKQNKLIKNRCIFKKLNERHISIFDIVNNSELISKNKKEFFVKQLENLFLNKKYASFMEEFFILSDEYEKGNIKDISSIFRLGELVLSSISGKENVKIKTFIKDNNIPEVLKIGLNSFLSGIEESIKNQ